MIDDKKDGEGMEMEIPEHMAECSKIIEGAVQCAKKAGIPPEAFIAALMLYTTVALRQVYGPVKWKEELFAMTDSCDELLGDDSDPSNN